MIPFLLASVSFIYPNAPEGDTIDHYHGIEVRDPYRYLEDSSHPETQAWLKAQHNLAESYFAKLSQKEEFENLLNQLSRFDRRSAPLYRSGSAFFLEMLSQENQWKLCVKQGDSVKTLLNPLTLSQDGLISIVDFEPSLDGHFVACLLSQNRSDWQTIRVIDSKSGEFVGDEIPWVKFCSIAWDPDGFYYTPYPECLESERLTAANSGQKLAYHSMKKENERILYENQESSQRHIAVKSDSKGEWLTMTLFAQSAFGESAVYLKKRGEENFSPLIGDFDYSYQVIDMDSETAYIYTNEGSDFFQLIGVDLVTREKCTLLPASNLLLKDVALLGKTLAAVYEKDAHHLLHVYTLGGQFIREVDIGAFVKIEALSPERDSSTLTVSLSTFSQPPSLLQYDPQKDELRPLFASDQAATLSVSQHFFQSRDGTKVPLFLLESKNTPSKSPKALLLTGYGGFDISYLPGYNPLFAAFVQLGGAVAVVNLRGGGEYGQNWHRAGMKELKQNVFDDFSAAAHYLIENRIAEPEKIASIGGSNGGLLVAATMIQNPTLFKAVIPCVGVLDMLRFQHFTVGRLWVPEYGCSEVPDEFSYLYAYSPLHALKRDVSYPATLILTGDHDDRVVPAHSYKFAAALQKSAGQAPRILRVDSEAGHGLGKPVNKKIAENALILQFLHAQLSL